MSLPYLPRIKAASLALAFLSALSLQAQTPPPITTPNAVLTTLTIKPGVQQAELMKVMPEEARATLQLYLDGKIQQWWARADGKRGVIFVLNCKTVEEAKSVMDTLPLSKASYADFEFIPVGPLTPLRILLAPPQPKER